MQKEKKRVDALYSGWDDMMGELLGQYLSTNIIHTDS